VTVKAGASVLVPTGWSFQFRATGSDALRILCCTMRPRPGEDEAVPVEFGGLSPPAL
jgi:mannose-6-phosphate isomerase-like protein (cupin superfamily)